MVTDLDRAALKQDHPLDMQRILQQHRDDLVSVVPVSTTRKNSRLKLWLDSKFPVELNSRRGVEYRLLWKLYASCRLSAAEEGLQHQAWFTLSLVWLPGKGWPFRFLWIDGC